MAIRPLTDLMNKDRLSPEQVAAMLQQESNHASAENGLKLVNEAASFGLSMRDYLILHVAPAKSKNAGQYAGLNGYEATKLALNLPHANDFEHGIALQAAANTFQVYTGTRALFPEVIDDMLKEKTRMEQVENIASLVSQSRTVDQVEMITTYLEDDSEDRKQFTVSELGRVPVRSVRTSQNVVNFGKRGSGIEMSYEFGRRASLDILTPFAARIVRETELSKVAAATDILINGDNVNAAAQVIPFSTYGGSGIDGANFKALSKFLMARAKAGYPVDTLVVNYDMYIDLMFMYQPTLSGNGSIPVAMEQRGAPAIQTNVSFMANMGVNVVISSAVPAGRIIAMSKMECLEELIEAGSNISENERSIKNQSVTYIKTETTGYKLAIPQARVILNTTA